MDRMCFLLSAAVCAALNVPASASSAIASDPKSSEALDLFKLSWAADFVLGHRDQAKPSSDRAMPDSETATSVSNAELITIDETRDKLPALRHAKAVDKTDASTTALKTDTSSLELAVTGKFGSHAVGNHNHLAHGRLRAEETWLVEADANWKGESPSGLRYETAIGFFNYRQPFLESRGGIGLAHPEFWEQQFVLDTGVKVSDRDDTFAVAGGIALSEGGFERHFANEPWLVSLEHAAVSGEPFDRGRATSSFVAVDAALLETDLISLDLNVDYSRSEGNSRSRQSRTLGQARFPGQYLGADLTASFNGVEARSSAITLRSKSYDLDEISLSLSQGPYRLDVGASDESLNLDGLRIAEDETLQAGLSIDLTELVPEKPGWAPDEILFAISDVEAQEAYLDQQAAASRFSVGAGVSKFGDWSHTDIYAYVSRREDTRPGRSNYSSNQIGIDVTQELYFGDWDVSAYVSASDQDTKLGTLLDATDRSLSGGVALAYRGEAAPHVSLSVDLFEEATDYYLDDYAYRSHEYSVRGQVDFRDIFGHWDDRSSDHAIPLNLSLNAYHGWNEYRETPFPVQEAETRLLVQLSSRF